MGEVFNGEEIIQYRVGGRPENLDKNTLTVVAVGQNLSNRDKKVPKNLVRMSL